jgi:predicted acyl esterase
MWTERLENNGLWLLDWFRHQRRDDFYRHGSICEDYTAIKVPVYAVGGYADGYTNPIFRMMEHLACPRKALIGPWTHRYPHVATPEPRIGFLQECLRWWDQHLKGIETGIMAEPRIRAWMQEAAAPDPAPKIRPGRWIAEPAWPPAANEVHTLHVTPEGLRETAGGPVVIDCPETAGHAAPLWCMYGPGADGPLDQNAEAGFMQIYETAPLAADVEILGFPLLQLCVASDVPQANLAAVLSLVAPDGRATFMTYGILNLTHRESHAAPEALRPGDAVDATLQLNVIGQRVPAGHRLRLALSQAYWPVIWPSARKARLTLEHARLDLPLRPARASEPALPDFGPPEAARPLETEVREAGGSHRTRLMDYATGAETHERFEDTGRVTHLHTGLTLRTVSRETFGIHPDDPNSATGTCRWDKSFARGDWRAELAAEVHVAALPDAWRITARLTARDGDGLVAERAWAEDVPRDLV